MTAYLIAGVTVSELGPRGAIGIAAAGTAAVLLYAAVALRRAPDPVMEEPASAQPLGGPDGVAVEPVG